MGYIAPLNKINDIYVSSSMIQKWLDSGKSKEQIFLIWNSGDNKKCSKGKNSKGINYNSCEYIKNGVVAYNNI